MARTGQKIVKSMILTPLIAVAMSLLMWVIFRLGINPDSTATDLSEAAFALFLILTAFSMTIGLIMSVTGTVMAIVKKSRAFIILGSILSAAIIVSDVFLIVYIISP